MYNIPPLSQKIYFLSYFRESIFRQQGNNEKREGGGGMDIALLIEARTGKHFHVE